MHAGQDAWVYILANPRSRTIYTGVTNNLERRVAEHKAHANKGFTDKYNVTDLVYCEQTTSILDAIAREKQLKKWNRAKKVALIERANPQWRDLAKDW